MPIPKNLEALVCFAILIKIRKKVIITFIDNGVEFDVLAAKSPNINLSLEERDIGGFGIYLVKSLMDKISYKRLNNKNILVLEKIVA